MNLKKIIAIVGGSLFALIALVSLGIILFITIFTSTSKSASCEAEPDTEVTGEAGGGWLKPGSKSYKNAKDTYDAFTSHGTSGAAASGVLGWIAHETGNLAIVDRAEGRYGNDDTKVGVAYGNAPIPSRTTYSVGGAGVYQFTPYTRFAPLNDKKWLDMGEQTKFVLKSIAKGDWISAHDLTGGHHSFKEFAHESDPTQATLMWNAYERGDVRKEDTKPRQADAMKAYKTFGGANISANDSLLGQLLTTSDDTKHDVYNNDDCDLGGSSTADWTGKVPDDAKGKVFAAYEIPDSLKKYLLPINLSGNWGSHSVSGKSWGHPGGQCVDYSVSEVAVLWNKTTVWSEGDGIAQVKGAIKRGFGEKDDKPHKGDLVSSDGTDPSVGHTWIVGHVFEDGSVLVQEENYSGKSGDSNGTPNTWDVGILPPWKGQDSWANTPLWGKEMAHATFAKPKHGMKVTKED